MEVKYIFKNFADNKPGEIWKHYYLFQWEPVTEFFWKIT